MGDPVQQHVQAVAPYVPAPRTSEENASRRHRAPSVEELVQKAALVIRRDSLAPSGYVVAQLSATTARHQHAVWQLGPFALLADGWFGVVHGREAGGEAARWLRGHERRCTDQHWTHFSWIDTTQLDAGCGASDHGIGLTPGGPTYCSGAKSGQLHPVHVPLVDVVEAGLRALAVTPPTNGVAPARRAPQGRARGPSRGAPGRGICRRSPQRPSQIGPTRRQNRPNIADREVRDRGAPGRAACSLDQIRR